MAVVFDRGGRHPCGLGEHLGDAVRGRFGQHEVAVHQADLGKRLALAQLGEEGVDGIGHGDSKLRPGINARAGLPI